MPGAGETERRLLLRVWMRRTSVEEKDVREIQKAEFEDEDGDPDLFPSVYEVTPADVVRVVVEHYAGNGLDRVSNEPVGHPDLKPLHSGEVRVTPGGQDWFEFPRDTHRELVIADLDELDRLIVRIKAGCDRYPCTKKDAQAFVRQRREAKDPKWLLYFRDHEKGRKWEALAKKGGG